MKIMIAGDFCPQNRVSNSFEKGDFQSVLGDIKDTISAADYSIVNFECPIVNGGEKKITKCGPALSCSLMGMKAVKWVGFNCVTLANNHFLDYGEQGAISTLEKCKNHGIDTVGGAKT